MLGWGQDWPAPVSADFLSGVLLPPIPLQLPARGHTPSWFQNVSTRLEEYGFHLDKSLLTMPVDVSKIRLQN